MYEIYAQVLVHDYIPYFPCGEKLIGFYTVEEYEDHPMNQTAVIKQHIQKMVDKLVAAGYDSRRIYTNVANEGDDWYEFGEISINEERMIIQGRNKYEY